MDLATVVGIVLCIILILGSILMGGAPIIFVNIPSVLIVVAEVTHLVDLLAERPQAVPASALADGLH